MIATSRTVYVYIYIHMHVQSHTYIHIVPHIYVYSYISQGATLHYSGTGDFGVRHRFFFGALSVSGVGFRIASGAWFPGLGLEVSAWLPSPKP